MTINTYLEANDPNNQSYQRLNFSLKAASISGAYDYTDPDGVADIQSVTQDILGYTYTGTNSTQGLKRDLPCVHPATPYTYAKEITSFQGMGRFQKQPAVLPALSGTPGAITGEYGLYQMYRLGVKWDTLPYTVLPDSAIPINTSSWYPDGVLASDSPTSFTYAAEWLRYTDYDIVAQNNNVVGSTGQSSFKDLTPIQSFTNPPSMYLPDSILTFTWFQVPYRYITSPNSYIANRGWRGRINQNDWYNWPAGSLLYLSYTPTKYTQPNAEVQTLTDLNGNTYDSFAKLCDITFTFLLTNRTAAITPATPYYGNWIAAGHNLNPHLLFRNFYYTSATNTKTPTGGTITPAQAGWNPSYNSYPMEILFSDPDVPGGP